MVWCTKYFQAFYLLEKCFISSSFVGQSTSKSNLIVDAVYTWNNTSMHTVVVVAASTAVVLVIVIVDH